MANLFRVAQSNVANLQDIWLVRERQTERERQRERDRERDRERETDRQTETGTERQTERERERERQAGRQRDLQHVWVVVVARVLVVDGRHLVVAV